MVGGGCHGGLGFSQSKMAERTRGREMLLLTVHLKSQVLECTVKASGSGGGMEDGAGFRSQGIA